MQTVSDNFKRIASLPEHRVQTKVVVGGTEFTQGGGLWSISTTAAAMGDTPGVGNCISAQIDLELKAPGVSFPRMCPVEVYCRVVSSEDGTDVSEWIPKGKYFSDTKEWDSSKTFCTIHGYDAMLMAQAEFNAIGDVGEWPRTMDNVAAEIADYMGVDIDPRTEIAPYEVQYPNDYSMSEVLGYIGVANAGNWIITDEGFLRLIKITDSSKVIDYLSDEFGNIITFAGVSIIV